MNRKLSFIRVFAAISLSLIVAPANAASPSWWTARGVINGNLASDYSVVNQGQLKWFATKAMQELDQNLPGGAGTAVHTLVAGWGTPTSATADYASVNLGQLKTVARVFYDQLIAVGYTNSYPWTGGVATDYAMANIGQVKNLFGFDVTYDSDGNGIPDWWEMKYFGRIGVNPSALVPSGSGLTFLQAYQEGINPQLTSPSEAFSVALSATGPFQAPANVVLVAGVSHPSSTTIAHVDFYKGATLLGSVTQSPYQLSLSASNPGSYIVKAIAYDSNNASVTASAQFNVTESNYYVRGAGINQYLSRIVAVDFEKGVPLDGVSDFSSLYPAAQYPALPWFLRTQPEANEPLQHIVSSAGGVGTYAGVNTPATAGGTAVGGGPPMVAFGSQGGGSRLFKGQSYNFGIAAGGQIPTAVTNYDIKVEVYLKSSFAASATKVAPVYTQVFTLPRTGDNGANPLLATAWSEFVANGNVADFDIVQPVSGGELISFHTQVQYVSGASVADTWGQLVNFPLLLTHKTSSLNYYYKVSVMGYTASGAYGPTVTGQAGDLPMGVDSTGAPTYNVSYSLDFDVPSPWQAAYINQPHFQGVPLPSAYLGKSVDELIHNAPPVSDTLTAPASTGLNLMSLDNSPELKVHSVLHSFVLSMNSDPMALANYVQNQIDLTDAVGYSPNQATASSINPQGVSRDALATFLEGQGSPAEQCALLIYLLRDAGYACGYVFPQQNGMLMFDQQLSSLLRIQIRGATDELGNSTVPELIPVNYPWVAVYINGQWVHLFPWLKDTSMEEGVDLWSYMPEGYQTGGQWLQHYLQDDVTIRRLSTDDNPGTLFPLYAQQQLAMTGLSLDGVGMNIYNRQDYYTSWQSFPRPWTTPPITNANLAQNLDYTQNPAALTPALQNIFDTVSIQVTSDRNNNGVADAGEPYISTGTLRLVDLHDRRFLLYHQVVPSTSPQQFTLTLSLEAFSSSWTGQYTFLGNGTWNGAANPDPGNLKNTQKASITVANGTDNTLLYSIIYNRNLQGQALSSGPLLGAQVVTSITDTRFLNTGDMACLCLDYGRVSQAMQEFQAEKYWVYQQQVAANPTAASNPELAQGELLYVMGQSYYRMVSNFQQQVENLTKTHAISWIAHGLTKFSPSRNADGTPNIVSTGGSNVLNLQYPRVDMAFQRAAWIGNGTSHLDSADNGTLAPDSAGQLMIGEASADEHRVINQFFQQNAAVSTVRLLDIDQGWTPSSPSATDPGGVISLTQWNYATLGSTIYKRLRTDGSGLQSVGQSLAAWAEGVTPGATPPASPPPGSLWAQVVSALTDPNYGSLTTVYMTHGPVTASGQQGQPYTGMGAFIIGVGQYGALITGNTAIDNGGYGGEVSVSVGDYTLSSTMLSLAPSGQSSVYFLSSGTTSAQLVAPSEVAFADVPAIASGITAGTIVLSPEDIEAASAYGAELGGDFSLGTLFSSMRARGNIGVITANNNMAFSTPNGPVATGGGIGGPSPNSIDEPVNAITGEFYENMVDLRLNGPMPLEIRRTYGSLNQADNNFGQGWRMGYFPYLMLSSDATVTNTTSGVPSYSLVTGGTLIYAAEMDGTVVCYRKQAVPNTGWVPLPSDNPYLANAANGAMGGVANLFNNRIDEYTIASSPGGSSAFRLTGADGSVRIFYALSYPAQPGGVALTRPFLQSWTDNRGNSYTFAYGTNSAATDYGQINRIAASNGNYVNFSYDTFGHIVKVTSGDGRILSYQYDTYGDLVLATLPDASTVAYSYLHSVSAATGTAPASPYSTHLIAQVTNPGGRILQNTYDSQRRVLTQSATVGTNETPVQNASFNYGTPVLNADGVTYNGSTVITDVKRNTTTYTYVANQITQITTPPQNGGATSQVTTQAWYGPADVGTQGYYPRSLKSRTDCRGLVSSYKYDANGNLLAATITGNLTGGNSNTETAVTTMTYNSAATVKLPGSTTAIPNTVASVTDPLGNRTVFTYGDASHPYLVTETDKYANASGSSNGTLVSGSVMQYTNMGATAYGLLQTATVAFGTQDQSVLQFTYNANGFPATKTQLSGTTDPNVVTTYAYDLRGEVISATDAAGRSTQYAYDARGNRTSLERYDEWGNLVSWDFSYYNQNGELEWEQGPRYNPNDYVTKQYDGAGRLTQEVKWLSAALSDGSGVAASGYATTLYSYDTYGDLLEIDDPNENATTMTYDAIGEMLTRTVHTGSNTGPTDAIESFTYEAGGKVATHTTILGGVETLTYTYTGKPKTDLLPDGTTKSWLYDLDGRVVRETLTNGSYWATGYNDAARTVTRTFYKASGLALGNETVALDRRGNVISKTDLAGNTFTTVYDGLGRVKTASGPPAASPAWFGSTAQESVTHVYDAAGVMHTASNAAGEETVTFYDALARPTLVSVFNANFSTASNTGYWYSPDHQSVVTTVGTGVNAITTTTFTDTRGLPVLVQHADGKFAATAYDPDGNKIVYVDEQGALTSWTYDALNHLSTEMLPASTSGNAALTTFTFNAAGELLTRQMPEGLTAKSVYDTAGRKTSEELDGAGGAVTRNFSYSYYGSGPAKGMLQTVTDPRGVTFTTAYDDWLRVSTVNSAGSPIPQQNQNTTYQYDIRGMVNSIAQSYVVGSTGPPTLVSRNFDAYGQMNQETVSVNGTVTSEWNQSWDKSGRRSALNFQLAAQGVGAGSQYGFTHNATGRLTGVANSGSNYSFTFGDNSLLLQRTTPLWTQTIAQRDTVGRIASENVTGNGVTLLSETMTYHGDSRLGTYDVSGAVAATESRDYGYDVRGRLQAEPFQLNNTQSGQLTGSQTATYLFDQTPLGGSGIEGGLGVRTLQSVTDTVGYQVTQQNNFLQSSQDYDAPQNGVSGTLSYQYDAVGNVLSRSVAGGQTQTMTWDAWGRLVVVSLRDSTNSGSDFTTVYDGFGRRTQSTFQNVTTGSANGAPALLTYYYDPQVEFLELGFNDSGTRTWRVFGPDLNGIYGGLHGTGGLAAIVDESSGSTNGSINDKFGNSLGLNGTGGYYLHGSELGGYGVMPGSSLDYAIDLDPQWRGHYIDWTGFYYMGARYYDPQSGRFLSPDPLGHGADMSLYAYCNGDPVNGLDPTGRMHTSVASGSLAGDPNSPSDYGVNLGIDGGLYQASNQAYLASSSAWALGSVGSFDNRLQRMADILFAPTPGSGFEPVVGPIGQFSNYLGQFGDAGMAAQNGLKPLVMQEEFVLAPFNLVGASASEAGYGHYGQAAVNVGFLAAQAMDFLSPNSVAAEGDAFASGMAKAQNLPLGPISAQTEIMRQKLVQQMATELGIDPTVVSYVHYVDDGLAGARVSWTPNPVFGGTINEVIVDGYAFDAAFLRQEGLSGPREIMAHEAAHPIGRFDEAATDVAGASNPGLTLNQIINLLKHPKRR